MASLRPRPQVMRLTDAAAAHIKDILGRAEGPIAGVRVGVKNGGCAGMSYTMEYAESAKPTDEVVVDKGVRLLIDLKADGETRPAFEREDCAPFSYQAGGSRRAIMSFWRLPERLYDDPDELA